MPGGRRYLAKVKQQLHTNSSVGKSSHLRYYIDTIWPPEEWLDRVPALRFVEIEALAHELNVLGPKQDQTGMGGGQAGP
jgi:hypothetical protein